MFKYYTFAKSAIRKVKICCTTYKKIWSYQKKAVSLQCEKKSNIHTDNNNTNNIHCISST